MDPSSNAEQQPLTRSSLGQTASLPGPHFGTALGKTSRSPETEKLLAWQHRGLKLLAEASADLLRGDRPESQFRELFERLLAHLSCDAYFNYEYDGKFLHLVLTAGAPALLVEKVKVLQPGEQLCGTAAIATGVFHLSYPELCQHPNARSALDASVRCFAGVSLRDGERLLGTLSYTSCTRDALSNDELDFLETLGHVVAAAKARFRDLDRLKKTEARYRAVTETSPDGFMIGDPQGNIIEVNDSYLKMVDRSRDEIMASKVWEIDTGLNQEQVLSLVSEMFESRTGRLETTHRTRAGRDLPVEVVSSYWSEPENLFFSFIRDMTEQKRVEAALRSSEARTRLAIENSGVALWEADPATGDFLSIFGSEEGLLGYSREQWLEPGFWPAHIYPDDVSYATSFCAQSTAALIDHRFEYRMLRADGRVVWVEDVVKVEAVDGRPVRLQGLLLDITDRKRFEEGQLQSQKLEAVGRLAGGVAHDFNNLLTVINGYAELLSLGLPRTDPRLEWVNALIDAGERARRLTDQLLLFSRKSHVSRRVINLNDEVERTGRLLRRLIGEDILLKVECRAENPHVDADPTLIEQIVMNLALNSRDAMPRGGKLTICTQRIASLDEAELGSESRNLLLSRPVNRNPLSPDQPFVELTVSDTGVGIDSEDLPRLFEPFFTTKAIGKGTGLGLAVVYGIVQQSEGEIDITSQLGRGTTIRVRLPLVDRPLSVPQEPTQAASGGDETILLVEDEEAVRQIARLALTRHGYRVLDAASGTEALQLAASIEGSIDLLVTDVIMAGLGGKQLAEQLRALRPDLRVLFMSGYTDDAVLRYGIGQELDSFLRKPFTPDGLATKVREILTSRT